MIEKTALLTITCVVFLYQGPRCKNQIDIGFIVDSSGSLRREYHKEKEFVKRVVESLDLSPNGSRASIITFSRNAEHSVKLNERQDLPAFTNAVDNLPMFGKTTRIDRALKMAREEMFSPQNGARAGIPKLLILLTDGSQTKDVDAIDPAVVAKEIRDKGVILLVIGIGKNTNHQELLKIAGKAANVYQASNFDELKSSKFIDDVSKSSCEKGKYV